MHESSSTVYFAPGFNPSYFYPLLKPLCVLYDRVFVWSPLLSELEECGFTEPDFLAACQLGPAAVIAPSGRPAWFDRDRRASHPDEKYHQFFGSFDRRLKAVATEGGWILDPDYELGYAIVDRLLDSSESTRLRIEEITDSVGADWPEGMRIRAEAVAAQNGRTVSWAIANSYVQDIIAMRRLGAQAPFLRLEQASGYLVLASAMDATSRTTDLTLLRERIVHQEAFPGLELPVPPNELQEFLDQAYGLSRAPWSDVMDLRRSGKGEQMRRWLAASLQRQRRPLESTISEIAKLRGKALYERAENATQTGASIIAGAVGATIGFTTALAAGSQAGVLAGVAAWKFAEANLTRLARLFAPIHRLVAHFFGGNDTILVDTPFFAGPQLSDASN